MFLLIDVKFHVEWKKASIVILDVIIGLRWRIHLPRGRGIEGTDGVDEEILLLLPLRHRQTVVNISAMLNTSMCRLLLRPRHESINVDTETVRINFLKYLLQKLLCWNVLLVYLQHRLQCHLHSTLLRPLSTSGLNVHKGPM